MRGCKTGRRRREGVERGWRRRGGGGEALQRVDQEEEEDEELDERKVEEIQAGLVCTACALVTRSQGRADRDSEDLLLATK